MATVAGGVIGAAIGGFGWGWGSAAVSIGWAIGSAIGSYADQPDTPDQMGPRLAQTKIQESSYGQFLKIPYGRDRVGGTLIWLANNRLDETRHEEDIGGKGGDSGTATSFTYSASMAIAICEGPIAGIARIWADSVLIYDRSSGASASSIIGSASGITVYLGDETQAPDSLMESYLGAGNVPGYRGTAYVVFDDFQLEKYGSRIPNFTFEVMTDATESYVVDGSPIPYPANSSNIWVLGINDGIITYWEPEIQPGGYMRAGATISKYTLSGQKLEDVTSYAVKANGDPGYLQVYYPVRGEEYFWTGYWNGLCWIKDGSAEGRPLEDPTGAEISPSNPPSISTRYSGVVYTVLGEGWQDVTGRLLRFDSPSVQMTETRASHEFNPGGGCIGFDPHPEGIYAHYVISSAHTLYLLDRDDLSVIDSWSIATAPTEGNFAVHGGRIIYGAGSGNGWWVYELNDDSTSTLLDSGDFGSGATVYPASAGKLLLTSGRWVSTGLIDSIPHQVDEIVTDLCERAGLAANDIDVTALDGDTVDGYTITSLQSLSNSIQPLMPVLRFDMAQIDWKLRVVKRGAEPVATITADKLAAHEYGQERPDEVVETRQLESTLPREVIFEYSNGGQDYLKGLQRASRVSVDSKHVISMASPVVMGDDLAAQTTDVILKAAWTERNRYDAIPLSWEYSRLTPTDVIEVQASSGTYTVRITEIDDHVGLLRIKGVADRAADYTSAVEGVPGNYGESVIGLVGPTKGIMLDIPIQRDQDDDAGFYAAVTGYLDAWAGAVAYKSLDGGQTYNSLLPFTAGAVVGTATDTLPDGPTHIIDETSTVNVRLIGDRELSSVTETAMLNGANTVAFGADGRWEILRFQTATLEADGTYTLSNLLRGLRGTEWATGTHQTGDTLVVLNTSGGVQRIPGQQSELEAERTYKFVSFGRRLAEADEVPFTNTGVGLKPFSPQYVRGSRDGSDNLTVSWYARGRMGSGFRVSQDDITGYEVDVLDGSTVVRTLTTTDTGDAVSLAYSAADQTTDFGSPQSSVTVRVYAIHSVVGRGYAAEATI